MITVHDCAHTHLTSLLRQSSSSKRKLSLDALKRLGFWRSAYTVHVLSGVILEAQLPGFTCTVTESTAFSMFSVQVSERGKESGERHSVIFSE